MNVSEMLGLSYSNLQAAQVDKSPEELVVTENENEYYIVSLEAYENTLKALNYKIIVNIGE